MFPDFVTRLRYQVSVYRTIGPLVCSNDVTGVTLTYFTARSNLVIWSQKGYKKKNTEHLKAVNEYKDNVDMTFEEF